MLQLKVKIAEEHRMYSTKRIVLNWITNYQLQAENEKGIKVKFDAPITHGGEETALSPMENVLASLAACSSFHVLTILKKKIVSPSPRSIIINEVLVPESFLL